ncbi:HEAT repeat domain-containing protein [Streptomyces anulatus]|uniref:HEAT repeat domain-containing protein n=1 Tax=Streptomyces anulatus TaxID=1892 RepID=UPI001D18E6D8|nr:HEAT repeat domain-containing protein [Streptomyces anulatus]
MSSWAPPLGKPEKFVVPQDGDVLLAVVAVWSAWSGQPALDGQGRVEQRWLKAARPEWDRLLDAAQRERAVSRERGDEQAQVRAAVAVYLGRVREVHRRLNLDVLGPSGLAGEQPVIELRQVFMPQACRPFVPHLEEGVRRRLVEVGELVDDEELSRSARELGREEAARQAVVQPVLSVLAQESGRRLVVLGDPGAGKSTLAKYLTLALAGGLSKMPSSLEPLAGLVPVLVELRQYAQPHWRERTIEEFLDHVHVQERMGLPRPVLEGFLESGRAVVVFDGLDEIFDPAVRAQTTRRITAFSAHYRQVRTVVTSREYGYRSHEFVTNNFAQVMLQNLDPGQVETFIRRWYAAAHPEKPQLANQLIERLLSAVRTVRPVAELAGNPLLLTILAAIGMGRTIPRERREVYAHAIDVLVERWDKDAKFLTPPSPPTSDVAHALEGLTAGRRVKLLERIARAMQEGAGKPAGTFIRHDDLTGIIRNFLTESNIASPAADVAAGLMVEHLRSRNFLLAHYGGGLYGFVHRTFLEYLAATDLLRRREEEEWTRDHLIDLLTRQARDPHWHEVLLLMAGGLKQRDVAALLSRLLQLHRQHVNNFHEAPMLVLAIRVLAETADIGAPYVPGTSDPHLSVAAQSDAVIDALTAALQGVFMFGLQEALPALGTFGHFWSGRDRYMRWYYAQEDMRLDFFGTAGAVAAALSRNPREAIVLFHASSLGNKFEAQRGPILAALGERWHDRPEAFDTIMRATTDTDPGVRRTALAALGERWHDRPEAFDTIMRATTDTDPGVRHTALTALGERWHDRPEAFDTIMRATTDTDPGVRHTALAALRERWHDQPQALDTIMRATTDNNADVRHTALAALRERWHDRPEAFDTIMRATTDTDPGVRHTALAALGWWHDRPEAFDTIMRATTDTDPGVRHTALAALGWWHDRPEAFDTIMRATTDTDPGVRHTALAALGWWHDRPEAFDTIMRATTDTDPGVRHTALAALGWWHDRPEAFDTIMRATTDTDPGVRHTALAALGWWHDRPEAFDTIMRATTDTDPGVRHTALAALGWWHDRPEAFDTIMRATTDTDPGVRHTALAALGWWHDRPEAFDTIMRATTDTDPGVRHTALAALGWWHDRPEAFDTIMRATTDTDPGVRHTALAALGWWHDRPEAFDTIMRATTDTDPDVRRAVMRALAHRYPDRACRALTELAAREEDEALRADLVRVITLVWPDEPDVPQFLKDKTAADTSDAVRGTARKALAFLQLRSSLSTEQGAPTAE